MSTIQISGITYKIISQKKLDKTGRIEIKLRRPAGRRDYFAVVYENGSVSEVV